MATRFYFETTIAADVSPSFNAGWEQTGQAVRRKLVHKNKVNVRTAIAASASVTIPITTTQDILCAQFVSEPLLAQRIDTSCLFAFVARCLESATTANATLAVVVSVVSNDGSINRGTLFSTFTTGTEFPITTSATRIVKNVAVTALTIQSGDRIVIEVGAHAAAPTAATSFAVYFGFNAASDHALTAAITTVLNPWCEFSKDVFTAMPENFMNFKAPDGLSSSGSGTRL